MEEESYGVHTMAKRASRLPAERNVAYLGCILHARDWLECVHQGTLSWSEWWATADKRQVAVFPSANFFLAISSIALDKPKHRQEDKRADEGRQHVAKLRFGVGKV
jgi:hypothetical protein